MRSLRELPSVDEVRRSLHGFENLPPELVVREIRSVLEAGRAAIRGGEADGGISFEETVTRRLRALTNLSLRRVINATGIILHTNLGRAPLPAFTPVNGYSNLEYDLATGKRGKRDLQISPLLELLLGKTSIVVNNNAAAVYLVLNELASGYEAIASRGELIEIGDGFRIPDIMARAGVVLREVGTTNRTRVEDYQEAITERTRLILRVHRSNFYLTGFTSRPTLSELAALGQEKGISVYEDLGSGCLVDLRAAGINEPLVKDSFSAGINIVSFSCDKLLGGPQAGIVAGDPLLVQRVRRNPMYRAFRVDKLILQALQTTLQHVIQQDFEQLPALRMIMTPLDAIRERAHRVSARLGWRVQVRESESAIGGGSTPDQKLPSWVVELDVADAAALERKLRAAKVPVICRIERDRIILDMRTVSDEEEPMLIAGAREALG